MGKNPKVKIDIGRRIWLFQIVDGDVKHLAQRNSKLLFVDLYKLDFRILFLCQLLNISISSFRMKECSICNPLIIFAEYLL